MKTLIFTLFLCVLFPLMDASCYRKMLEPGTTQCQDKKDKTWHPVGSSWRNSACEDCTCEGCCLAYSRPVKIPDGCMMEFDKYMCEYAVFQKNDPSKACPVLRAVGK